MSIHTACSRAKMLMSVRYSQKGALHCCGRSSGLRSFSFLFFHNRGRSLATTRTARSAVRAFTPPIALDVGIRALYAPALCAPPPHEPSALRRVRPSAT
jgi:hypothetical protein